MLCITVPPPHVHTAGRWLHTPAQSILTKFVCLSVCASCDCLVLSVPGTIGGMCKAAACLGALQAGVAGGSSGDITATSPDAVLCHGSQTGVSKVFVSTRSKNKYIHFFKVVIQPKSWEKLDEACKDLKASTCDIL